MSNHDRSKQRDEPIKAKFLTNTCNLLKEREKSRVQGAIALVLLPIGWQTGAEILSQSLGVAIASAQLLSRDFVLDLSAYAAFFA